MSAPRRWTCRPWSLRSGTRAARRSRSGRRKSASRSSGPASTRRSCGRYPRRRATSGASRCVSPRPTRVMAGSAAAHEIEPLFSAERIAERVEELAQEIAASRLKDPIIVAVLKGSFIFAADLIRALHRQGLKPEIDFIFLASYGAGTHSSGEVEILREVETKLEGRDVVIVDDILDSGRTLAFAKA